MKHELPKNVDSDIYDDLCSRYIRKKLYRDILHDKYIDGMTFEEIAEKYDRSVRGIAYICHREGDRILDILSRLE